MSEQVFHADVMPPAQEGLLRDLGGEAHACGYYLAGGTAVALWLGHRRSIDFDWFAQSPTVGPEDIAARLAQHGKTFVTKSQSLNLIDGHIDGIRVTFVRYAYPSLESPTMWPSHGCGLASLLDLGCMKLAAIAQRGSRKDFIDIHALLGQGLSLSALLDDYRRKYQVTDTLPVLRGIVYFDDAEAEPMPDMLVPMDWIALKNTLRQKAKEAVDQLRKSIKR